MTSRGCVGEAHRSRRRVRARAQREVLPRADVAPAIVVDLADLLRVTGTGSIEELADLVDGDCDADIWIDEADGAVEIGAGTGAICLEYPFGIDGFWSTVDEVEREQIARWEAAAENG